MVIQPCDNKNSIIEWVKTSFTLNNLKTSMSNLHERVSASTKNIKRPTQHPEVNLINIEPVLKNLYSIADAQEQIIQNKKNDICYNCDISDINKNTAQIRNFLELVEDWNYDLLFQVYDELFFKDLSNYNLSSFEEAVQINIIGTINDFIQDRKDIYNTTLENLSSLQLSLNKMLHYNYFQKPTLSSILIIGLGVINQCFTDSKTKDAVSLNSILVIAEMNIRMFIKSYEIIKYMVSINTERKTIEQLQYFFKDSTSRANVDNDYDDSAQQNHKILKINDIYKLNTHKNNYKLIAASILNFFIFLLSSLAIGNSIKNQ